MASTDPCVTLVPYFKVEGGKLDDFRALCERFVMLTQNEAGCLHYAFSFNGDEVHCREGYRDGPAVLAHLENVGAVLQEALGISKITRLEVHGPAAQLEVLREPLAGLAPQWFTVEYGFRR